METKIEKLKPDMPKANVIIMLKQEIIYAQFQHKLSNIIYQKAQYQIRSERKLIQKLESLPTKIERNTQTNPE